MKIKNGVSPLASPGARSPRVGRQGATHLTSASHPEATNASYRSEFLTTIITGFGVLELLHVKRGEKEICKAKSYML